MKRKTAKKLGIVMYLCILVSIPAILYLQIQHETVMSIILVGLMFAISMGSLWVSDLADRTERKVLPKPEKSVSK